MKIYLTISSLLLSIGLFAQGTWQTFQNQKFFYPEVEHVIAVRKAVLVQSYDLDFTRKTSLYKNEDWVSSITAGGGPVRQIHNAFYDGQYGVWLQFREGLFYYDGNDFEEHKIRAFKGNCKSVVDGYGHIWVLESSGTLHKNEYGVWKDVSFEKNISPVDIFIDEGNQCILVHSSGYYTYGNSLNGEETDLSASITGITGAKLDVNERLIFEVENDGFYESAWSLTDEKFEALPYSSKEALPLHIDSENNYWFLEDRVLNQYASTDDSIISSIDPDSFGLTCCYNKRVYTDARNELWIGGANVVLHHDGSTLEIIGSQGVLNTFDTTLNITGNHNGDVFFTLVNGIMIYRRTAISSLEEAAPSTFSLYPNPVTGTLNIKLESDHNSFDYRILNTLGQEVKRGRNQNTVDISSFKPGIYSIQISTSSGGTTSKMFIRE